MDYTGIVSFNRFVSIGVKLAIGIFDFFIGIPPTPVRGRLADGDRTSSRKLVIARTVTVIQSQWTESIVLKCRR